MVLFQLSVPPRLAFIAQFRDRSGCSASIERELHIKEILICKH
jgi:hypothetical protein